MALKANADHWSECGQIFFHYGKGWGITPTLQRICLGKEADIMQFFETGEFNPEWGPMQRHVLIQISEYRKEQDIGNRERDMERGGFSATSRNNKETARSSTPGKRLTVRASHKKHNHLLC